MPGWGLGPHGTVVGSGCLAENPQELERAQNWMRGYSTGLGPLKQEAGGKWSRSIVFLWVGCSEEKKKDPGGSVGLGTGR